MAARTDKTRIAKVGHKKSRAGCLTCRSRRVKCDEQLPHCNNCTRLGLDCSYPEPGGVRSQGRANGRNTRSSKFPEWRRSRTPLATSSKAPDARPTSNGSSDSSSPEHLPYRHDRMELRLLHAWMSRAINTPALSATSAWRRVWLVDLPEMALRHDCLLYAMFAMSATQLSGAIPTDPDLTLARYKYWSLALAEQAKAVAEHERTHENVEAVSFAAWLVSANAFGMLRDRDLHDADGTGYVPPVEWFDVSAGAWKICPFQEDIPIDSPLRVVVDLSESIWRPGKSMEIRVDVAYEQIMHRPSLEDGEEDMPVYAKVLTLISAFREGVLNQEPPQHHVRRISIVPELVPGEFVKFLRERRPRALVVLACFFAVTAHTGALRHFGDVKGIIPSREVNAIAAALPDEWRGQATQILEEVSSGLHNGF